MKGFVRVLIAVAIAALVGCSQEPAEQEAAQPAPEQPTPRSALADMPDPVKLDADAVERYIAAAEALAALGDRTTDETGAALSGEALAILEENDFEPVEFQRVGQSIGMAMAAAEIRPEDRDDAGAEERLNQMKGTVPDEQIEMMRQQWRDAIQLIEKQPEGNVEVVAGYRDRLEAIE